MSSYKGLYGQRVRAGQIISMYQEVVASGPRAVWATTYMRSYVQLIYSLVALATFVVPFSALANGDGTVAVSVSGYGPTPQDARNDAVRQALQKTMQQLIVIDRRIENDEVTQDRLLSTMNGYVENFEEVKTIRDADQFRVDARVTVAASKIRNFLVTTNTRGGSVDGLSMFEELSREDTQQRAHKEILSRLFRGFPGQVIVAKAIAARPSTRRSGYIDIGYTLQVDEQWLSSLRETLAAIATRITSYGPGLSKPVSGQVSNFLAAYGAQDTTAVLKIPRNYNPYGPPPERPGHEDVCIQFEIKWDEGRVIYNDGRSNYERGHIYECYTLPYKGAPFSHSHDDSPEEKAVREALTIGGNIAVRFVDGQGRNMHREPDQSCILINETVFDPDNAIMEGNVFLPYWGSELGRGGGSFNLSTATFKGGVSVPASAASLDHVKYMVMVVGSYADFGKKLVVVSDVSDLEGYYSGARDICHDLDNAVDKILSARNTGE